MWANVALALFFVLIAAAAHLKRSKHRKLPPGPWRLPIIGNLHNLSGSKTPHLLLADLSKKHGPLMHLRLGQISTVVVSSRDAARSILKTHDHNFCDRPAILSARVMCNLRDVGFAPYGDYWRTMKKILVVELLSAKRVASFGHIRDAAVSSIIQEVLRAGTAPVDLSKLLYNVSNRTVSQVVIGTTNGEQQLNKVVQILDEMLVLLSGNLAELYPTFEAIICAFTGFKRQVRQLRLKMDSVLDVVIKKHMSGLSEAGNVDKSKDDGVDILTLLLRHYQLQDLDFPLSIEDVKSVVWDLFAAGTDTTSATLEWAMAEMIKNPEVMHKAQSEVRQVYQERGKIDDSVVDELPYLKLVAKESLRLHPPAPLLLPRQSIESCDINGHHIPAQTRVIINAWSLGRDPDYWVKPNKFYPERFLERPLDYKGTDYEYVPFGAGRRMCPGATFGLATVDVTLARLLCHFDWSLPDGITPEDMNMEETQGLGIRKKIPLSLVASTRTPI